MRGARKNETEMSGQQEATNQMHSEVLKSLFPLVLAQQGPLQRLSTQRGSFCLIYIPRFFCLPYMAYIHILDILCCVLSFLESIAIWEEGQAPQSGRAQNHFSRAPPPQRCRKGLFHFSFPALRAVSPASLLLKACCLGYRWRAQFLICA